MWKSIHLNSLLESFLKIGPLMTWVSSVLMDVHTRGSVVVVVVVGCFGDVTCWCSLMFRMTTEHPLGILNHLLQLKSRVVSQVNSNNCNIYWVVYFHSLLCVFTVLFLLFEMAYINGLFTVALNTILHLLLLLSSRTLLPEVQMPASPT